MSEVKNKKNSNNLLKIEEEWMSGIHSTTIRNKRTNEWMNEWGVKEGMKKRGNRMNAPLWDEWSTKLTVNQTHITYHYGMNGRLNSLLIKLI